MAVRSGNLSEDHVLASYRSFGQSRALRFVYNSTGADPQPIITSEATIPLISAIPNTVSTRLSVGGVDQGEELFTSTTIPDDPSDPGLDEDISDGCASPCSSTPPSSRAAAIPTG